MSNPRRHSRRILIGNIAVGGDAPVSVQSMTNTDTRNATATLAQIQELTNLGCEIIRVAVPDLEAAKALAIITEQSPIPVVADIHFDYRLALCAMENHASAVRINPGNLNTPEHVRQVAEKAQKLGIPIRVGANAGSIRPAIVHEMLSSGMNHDEAIAEALVKSALHECNLLEQYGMHNIKVALKSSSIPITIAACRKFATRTDYPLHIGITEAGTPKRGIIKSAVGIGALLLDGIGDTLRVSLTASPTEEVIAGIRILEACGLRNAEPEVVSCPTCGRTRINLIDLTDKVDRLLNEITSSGKRVTLKKIAIMGCAVNGPGEARDADLGIAGSAVGTLVIFKKGKVEGAYSMDAGFELLRNEILANTIPKTKPT